MTRPSVSFQVYKYMALNHLMSVRIILCCVVESVLGQRCVSKQPGLLGHKWNVTVQQILQLRPHQHGNLCSLKVYHMKRLATYEGCSSFMRPQRNSGNHIHVGPRMSFLKLRALTDFHLFSLTVQHMIICS